MNVVESEIKNILNNEDKSTWDLVSFGDVAREPRESISNLKDSHIERFVGLEHICPKDIHIRSWGNVADGTTFTRSFKKGQVLFGKRRAYQGKAALADFDGVCSGDILVLEANEEKMEPGLLPFLVHSEGFYNWAVSTSAGSLSPRTKFKDLARYEFRLPSRPLQKKLAELLLSTDLAEEKYKLCRESLTHAYNCTIENYFSKKDGWKEVPLKEIAQINLKSLSNKTDPDFEFSYLDIASILEPKKIGGMHKLKYSSAPSRARRIVEDGNIVLSMVRPYHQSFVLIEKGSGIIASTGTCVIQANPSEVDNRFLFHQFFTKIFLNYCEERMMGTNYPAITPTDIKMFKVFIPDDFSTQKKVADILEKFDELSGSMNTAKNNIRNLKFSIINRGFDNDI